MKIKEIRAKKPEALKKDVAQLRKELMSLRAQVSMGTTPKSSKHMKSIKKTLARINTIKSEFPNMNDSSESEGAENAKSTEK